MKRSSLMLLLIGVAIIFFGCEKENLVDPELNLVDQETTALKAAKVPTQFTGTCIPIEVDPPNINKWHDEADDWRVTGTTLWTQPDPNVFEGTALLIVDGENPGATRGTWEMSWHGIMTTNPNGKLKIVAHAVGTGIDGDVEGLTAKWKYSLDLDDGFFYSVKGKITE